MCRGPSRGSYIGSIYTHPSRVGGIEELFPSLITLNRIFSFKTVIVTGNITITTSFISSVDALEVEGVRYCAKVQLQWLFNNCVGSLHYGSAKVTN